MQQLISFAVSINYFMHYYFCSLLVIFYPIEWYKHWEGDTLDWTHTFSHSETGIFMEGVERCNINICNKGSFCIFRQQPTWKSPLEISDQPNFLFLKYIYVYIILSTRLSTSKFAIILKSYRVSTIKVSVHIVSFNPIHM